MEKLFTKIVGTPVYDDGARAITSVKDLVLDPADGSVLAFKTSLTKNRVIVPMDVRSWNAVIKVHNGDVIVDGGDILRLAEVQKQHFHIFRSKVETEDGKSLGKVNDFSVNSKTMTLGKLYVSKGFLGIVKFDGRIIPSKNIVEILPDKIVVKDDHAVVKQEKETAVLEEGVA